MKNALSLTVPCLLFSTMLSAQPTVLQSKVDSLFSAWTKPGFPGGVVAVVRNDSVVLRTAFGLNDLVRKKPLKTDDRFDLASMAKQFTAMCIALLEEQGKLNATDDIKKFYPNFSYQKRITVQHLLTHTSGIRDGYVLTMLAGKTNFFGKLKKKYDEKKLIFALLAEQTELNFEPGGEMAYTNVNYIILGDIVEEVSGQSLMQFADSAIFKPLGMTQTVFRDTKDMAINNMVTGYRAAGGGRWKKGELAGGIVGDHNLISSVDDMILWVNNFGNNRLGAGNECLIDKITTPDTLNDGSPLRYNYGLETGTYKGHQYVAHGGDNGSHTSFVIWFPDDHLSVIHLANHSDYRFTIDGVYTLADLFLGKQTVVENETEFELVDVPEQELKKLEGLYSFIAPNGLGHVRKLTVKEGVLYSSFHPAGFGQELKPFANERFVITPPNQSPVYFSFSEKGNGSAITMTEQQNERVLNFKKLDVDMFERRLQQYTGKYINPEVETRMKVKPKMDRLVMKYKSLVKFDMFPIAPDTFYMPEAPAIVIFNKPSGESIESMTVNAPDFMSFTLEKR